MCNFLHFTILVFNIIRLFIDTMQETSCPGEITLVSIYGVDKFLFTQTTHVYEDFHLKIPTKGQYLTGVTIVIPVVDNCRVVIG